MSHRPIPRGPLQVPALSLFLSLALFIPDSAAQEKILTVTTILSYREFIQAVGQDLVTVEVFIPPGANPHTYELNPGQLKELARAKLYVKVGATLEFERAWIDKIIRGRRTLTVCDSSRGIELLGPGEEEHRHGGREDRQGQAGKDPHVWLSPRNAQIIVRNIRDSLVALSPGDKDTFDRNAREYLRRLDSLDQEIKQKLAGLKNREFVVFHPAWGYFARDYGLEQIAVEVEGKEPSPRQIAQVVEAARDGGIKSILVSPQINPKTARMIAEEIGGAVVEADPLSGDYFGNLRKVAALLAGQD